MSDKIYTPSELGEDGLTERRRGQLDCPKWANHPIVGISGVAIIVSVVIAMLIHLTQ